jgi:hypothetical protein
MKSFFPTLFSLFCFVVSQGQDKIKTVELSDEIVFATVDRPGDLYLVTSGGQIQKYDKDGKLIIVYKHKTLPTIFDPRDGAKLFAYYRDKQEYDYLSPSFEITTSYRIDSAFAIEPWLIAPSGEHKLWVLDAADHSLKKVNVQNSEVELEVVIDSSIIQDATQFVFLREYQGFAFLLDPRKGIFIFNGMGKHIKTISVPGITSFNFLGEELYYLKPGFMEFLDLFSAEEREMNIEGRPEEILLTDERMFYIRKKSVDIFHFKP